MARSTELVVNGKRMSVVDAIAINERRGLCVKCKRPARAHGFSQEWPWDDTSYPTNAV